MKSLQYSSQCLADTDRLGMAMARVLPAGITVALHGTLGAGKTRLVQAVATACGVDPSEVLSPTFVLCHEYQGTTRTIYHFDVYRIADDDEFLALGPEEYFESEGITFVEWGERVEACLPRDRWDVHMEWSDDNRRQIEITANSPELEQALDQLHDELSRTAEGDDHFASN